LLWFSYSFQAGLFLLQLGASASVQIAL